MSQKITRKYGMQYSIVRRWSWRIDKELDKMVKDETAQLKATIMAKNLVYNNKDCERSGIEVSFVWVLHFACNEQILATKKE